MNATVEPLEGNNVKVTVTVPAEEVDRAVAERVRRHRRRRSRIPGFRKGKVPRPVSTRNVGRAAVLAEAAEDARRRERSRGASRSWGSSPPSPPRSTSSTRWPRAPTTSTPPRSDVGPSSTLTLDRRHRRRGRARRRRTTTRSTRRSSTCATASRRSSPSTTAASSRATSRSSRSPATSTASPTRTTRSTAYSTSSAAARCPQEFDDALLGARAGDEVVVRVHHPGDVARARLRRQDGRASRSSVSEVKAKVLPPSRRGVRRDRRRLRVAWTQLRDDIRTRIEQAREVDRARAGSSWRPARPSPSASRARSPSRSSTAKKSEMLGDFQTQLDGSAS